MKNLGLLMMSFGFVMTARSVKEMVGVFVGVVGVVVYVNYRRLP